MASVSEMQCPRLAGVRSIEKQESHGLLRESVNLCGNDCVLSYDES